MKNRGILFLLCAVAAIAIAVWNRTPSRENAPETVVLYCAHDATYAEEIIRKFEADTGLRVEFRFDEEANKSLGLTRLLEAEAENPRCDVFWNNQTLGTIRLKHAGILESYDSPQAKRIPAQFRDTDNQWTGFAGRLRVYALNTEAMEANTKSVRQALTSQSLRRVAIARPQFGTTLSHYSVIAADIGMDGLKNWHDDMQKRGIRVVRGNSMTKDLVAEGVCDLAFTDTDDAFVAIDDGKPLTMLPVKTVSGQTICLPNSVALIRNCPHPENARRLIDYLLSAETELALAQGAARQIPLGQLSAEQTAALGSDVIQLREWAADSVDLTKAAQINQQVLDWLLAEHIGQ